MQRREREILHVVWMSLKENLYSLSVVMHYYMYRNTIILICLFLIGACSVEAGESTLQEVTLLDLTKFKKAEYRSPTEVYGVVPEFVPLLSDGVLVPISGYGKVVVKENNIYIRDEVGKNLYVFKRDGNLTCVLDNRGRGPKEFLRITDFDVDSCGNIWILDGQKDKIFQYYSDGVYSKSYPCEEEYVKIASLGDGFLLRIASWNQGPHKDTFIMTDSLFRTKQVLMPIREKRDANYIWPSNFSVSGDKEICALEPISDYIYSITDSGVMEQITKVSLGNKTIPLKMRSNLDYNYYALNDYIFLFRTTQLTPAFLSSGVREGKWKSMIVDRKKEEMVFFDKEIHGCELVGSYAGGTIWSINEKYPMEDIPEWVKVSLKGGCDVLAFYSNKK